MARTDEAFIAHLRELFDPLGRFAARAMFGGWGVYLDGLIIGIVDEGRFYLKTDAESQARFAQAGSTPFVYMGREGPMTMSYWSVPEEALDATELMAPWARLAFEAALRRHAAKPPAKSPTKPKAVRLATKVKPARPAATGSRVKPGEAAVPKKAAKRATAKARKRSRTIAGSMAAKADRRRSR